MQSRLPERMLGPSPKKSQADFIRGSMGADAVGSSGSPPPRHGAQLSSKNIPGFAFASGG
jgi:hypothetical protein